MPITWITLIKALCEFNTLKSLNGWKSQCHMKELHRYDSHISKLLLAQLSCGPREQKKLVEYKSKPQVTHSNFRKL